MVREIRTQMPHTKWPKIKLKKREKKKERREGGEKGREGGRKKGNLKRNRDISVYRGPS